MLDLYKLSIFQAAAAEGSISRAAERLQLSQPAVSQHIRELEAALGVELFMREHRGVSLTPAGTTLLDYSRCLLRLSAEAESAVTNFHQLREGALSIGATPGAGAYLLPGWLRDFHARYPQLTVTLNTRPTEAIVEAVLKGELAFAIVEGERLPLASLRTLILQEIDMLLVMRPDHAWAGESTLSLQALDGQPFVLPPRGDELRQWLESTFASRALTLNPVAEVDSIEAIKQTVRAGLGLAMLPACALHDELAAGQLIALPLSDALAQRTLKLIWSRALPLRPLARAFLSYLADPYPQIARVLGEDSGPTLRLSLEGFEARGALPCAGSDE